ncbi:dUTPase domain-containing protein [Ceratobasidium sp. AG-Ba]|nr:dUTPase domain-containing protein [Ceratobasidium sp. AG-Ba]
MPSASAILYSPFDELDDRFTNAHRFGRPRHPERLLLRPNHRALLLLCPILPPSPTHATKSKARHLPAEAWQRILGFAMQSEDEQKGPCKVRFLLVCKSFQNLATPLLYSSVRIYTLRAFERFAHTLVTSDAKWDSIRRIPHSTPGRWVLAISLAQITSCSPLALDSVLVKVLPLTPFLTSLELDGRYVLSWRVAGVVPRMLRELKSVRVREEIRFEGVKGGIEDDAVTALVRTLGELEELSVHGPGLDLDEEEEQVVDDEPEDAQAGKGTEVVLPRLKRLTLLDCPYTPIYRMLTRASLPALEDLTLTTTPTVQIAPPEPGPGQQVTEIPTWTQPTPTSVFLTRHGETLRRLSLVPTQQWPPAPAPAPDDILLGSPELKELTLSMPLPGRLFPPAEPGKPRGAAPVSPLLARLALASPELSTSPTRIPTPPPLPATEAPTYALERLTLPIPTQSFLPSLISPSLKNLREVRFSSAKWLRRGMGRSAQGTGVNGEMNRWRRELARVGVRVVDSDGREEIEEVVRSSRPNNSMLGLSLGGKKGEKDVKREEVHGRRWSG